MSADITYTHEVEISLENVVTFNHEDHKYGLRLSVDAKHIYITPREWDRDLGEFRVLSAYASPVMYAPPAAIDRRDWQFVKDTIDGLVERQSKA